MVAHAQGRLKPVSDSAPSAILEAIAPHEGAPATQPAATAPASAPAPAASQPSRWEALTDADVARIGFDDLEPDQSTVTPVARNFDDLDADGKQKMDELTSNLADWEPGHVKDPVQRVRNLLAVAAIPDILQDQYESDVPLVVFRQIRLSVRAEDLPKVLAWIILNAADGTYPTRLSELGWDTEVSPDIVRDRCTSYAAKLLGRVEGKLPKEPAN
jgi:hypothetical protein